MLRAELLGGLGNMLFQIATTYALAWDNNDTCAFDHCTSIGQDSTLAYIDNIFSRIKFLNSNEFNPESYYHEPNFYFQKLIYRNNLKLNGYFQSSKYFDHKRKDIIDLFKPTDNIMEYIDKKYSFILNDDVTSIHVRRGDYLNLKTTHLSVCSESYYRDALEVISADKIVVFSDDIEWCKSNFKGSNFIFIEGEEDYIDLYLMSMCNNNIIANSSFSWWGAWLNNNKNKRVIVPNNWFNRGVKQSWCTNSNELINTKDLYCKEWEVL